MIWVIDASVAIKWVVPENLRDQALTLLDDTSLLEAPDLLYPELSNVAWKKVRRGEMSHRQATLTVQSIQRFIAVTHPSPALTQRALEMAFILDHPVYDCFYLACAEQGDGVLITADNRLCATVSGSEFAPLIRSLQDI